MNTVFAYTFGLTLALLWWISILTLWVSVDDPSLLSHHYNVVWVFGILLISIMTATLKGILDKIFQELKEIRKNCH